MTYPSTIGSSANGPPPRASSGRNFGERAIQLSGLSARVLGWRPDEFWRSTPAELAAALHYDEIEPVAADELQRLREQFPDG